MRFSLKVGRFNLLHLIWLGPLLFGLFAGSYFGIIFFRWQGQQDEVLGKLVTYKKQLDHLRRNLPIEEMPGEVNVGAVAIPSRVYDKNRKLIGEFYTERRSLITLDKLPVYVPKALIASEDREFYEHEGINYSAIMRAFFVNLLKLRFAQGGSTLTQQLAKVLFTNQEKTLSRKIFEYFCAREIEQHYTKEQILEMYLNLVYMGNGNYGIESASQFFFGKSAANITVAEAAMLIGLLPSPNGYSPVNRLDRSLQRQDIVLKVMVEEQYINERQKTAALKQFYDTWSVRENPAYKKESASTDEDDKENDDSESDNKKKKAVSGKYLSSIGDFPDRSYRINRAPFFLDHIRQLLLKKFSNDEITRGGLRVYTTLDYHRQKYARTQIKARIEDQKNHYEKIIKNLIKQGKLDQVQKLKEAYDKTNGVFITIEPASGYILTMVGGAEFSSKNQFNRALLAKRQVGSTMKPFVYYLALSKGLITAATKVADTPLKVGKHTFNNYDYKHLGEIPAREALRRSRNIPAVRLLQQVGIDDLRQLIADILDKPFHQISKQIPREIGIVLGTPSFTPLELAQMYATLVNRGIRVKPRDLLRVENADGKILWQDEGPEPETRVMKEDAAFLTLTLLQGVFEHMGTAGWVGRLRDKKEGYLNFDIAGKTGTTSDYKDVWFAGVTSDEVSVVWVGNDLNTTLGRGRAGGSVCAPAWINYIQAVRSDNPPAPFAEKFDTGNMTRQSYCRDQGCVPRDENSCKNIVKDQYFISGTEPGEFCAAGESESDPLLQ